MKLAKDKWKCGAKGRGGRAVPALTPVEDQAAQEARVQLRLLRVGLACEAQRYFFLNLCAADEGAWTLGRDSAADPPWSQRAPASEMRWSGAIMALYSADGVLGPPRLARGSLRPASVGDASME